MGHGMYASNQSLCDVQTIYFLFKHERIRELRLQLLQIVVPIVAHFITNSNYHEFKLVNLADLLWRGGLGRNWSRSGNITIIVRATSP